MSAAWHHQRSRHFRPYKQKAYQLSLLQFCYRSFTGCGRINSRSSTSNFVLECSSDEQAQIVGKKIISTTRTRYILLVVIKCENFDGTKTVWPKSNTVFELALQKTFPFFEYQFLNDCKTAHGLWLMNAPFKQLSKLAVCASAD